MRKFLIPIAFIGLVAFSSACQPKCGTCSGSVTLEQFLEDSLIQTANSQVSPIEYCDEQLEMLEANPVVVQESEVQSGGFTLRQVSTTNWTCE